MPEHSSAVSAREQLEHALRGVPLAGAEGSIKIARGGLTHGRGLLGVEKRHLPLERLLAIADALGIPAEFRGKIDETYDRSNFFYFGYEDRPSGGTLKLYPEYPVYIAPLTEAEASGPHASRPALYMVGYKWHFPRAEALAVTEYVWYVHLSRERVAARMAAIGDTAAPAFALARDLTLKSSADEPPPYIEATETGNPRLSFDVNLYAAQLTVGAIKTPLMKLAADYGLDTAACETMLAAVAHKPLGHISAGLDRHKQDFLTVYYEL